MPVKSQPPIIANLHQSREKTFGSFGSFDTFASSGPSATFVSFVTSATFVSFETFGTFASFASFGSFGTFATFSAPALALSPAYDRALDRGMGCLWKRLGPKHGRGRRRLTSSR